MNQGVKMSDIKKLDLENFEEEISNSETPVLVDFWAEWCGPCKMLTPILEELAVELSQKLIIAKVNLDDNQDLAMKYSIRSIPTLLLFKSGKLDDMKVGLLPKTELLDWVKEKI